jgi:hypothetical protein
MTCARLPLGLPNAAMMWPNAAGPDFAAPSRRYDSILAQESLRRTTRDSDPVYSRLPAKASMKPSRIGRGAMTKAAMPKTTMVNAHSGDIPTQNPCAQCGAPIAQPDWIEPGVGRVSYLWTCHACNYRFEAIAIFDEMVESPPLAA